MMRHARALFAAIIVGLCAGSTADAQGRAGRVGGRAAEQAPLARQLRQRFNGVIRQQLNLSDEKWKQFQQVDRQFELQRNQLRRDEGQARRSLRAAMQDTVNVDQTKIAQYLDQLTAAQRRRADLLEAEQKQLSAFLTPLQRAKLQALREQLAQRVRQLEQQGPPPGRSRGIP